jgi:hypothetical protein
MFCVYYYYYNFYYSITSHIITPVNISILVKGIFPDPQDPVLNECRVDLNSQRRCLVTFDVRELKCGVAFCVTL